MDRNEGDAGSEAPIEFHSNHQSVGEQRWKPAMIRRKGGRGGGRGRGVWIDIRVKQNIHRTMRRNLKNIHLHGYSDTWNRIPLAIYHSEAVIV
jgi:hypothetical protein